MASRSAAYRRVRWHNSLIVRTILLCAILLLCLLGSVYVITRYYYGEVRREMEAHTEQIADSLAVEFKEQPEIELSELEGRLTNAFETPVDLEFTEETQPSVVTVEVEPGGAVTRVARRTVELAGRPVLLTARMTVTPQDEIFRAFKNRHLAGLTMLFVVVLGLMVYLIAHTLRPLRELSESCAGISAGKLRHVDVRRNAGEILSLEQTFNHMVDALAEQERMAVNLRQAQRLSAIGTLAAGVAHDIRNPLNAIKLISSHAMDSLDREDGGGRAKRQLETIRSEVDRLEGIVDSFLSLARERELAPESCKVDELLQECVHLLAKDAEERGVRLVTELRAGEAQLTLDPKQWTRAILNVLINALEATPTGGRVRLFSRVTDVICEIEVRDDGPGLPSETAEQVFDPYFTTKPTGTGLGLSITRGIVQEHGGTISLSSAEGRGTQVLITLPLEREPV
jgi:signal transduction histidine kinase